MTGGMFCQLMFVDLKGMRQGETLYGALVRIFSEMSSDEYD